MGLSRSRCATYFHLWRIKAMTDHYTLELQMDDLFVSHPCASHGEAVEEVYESCLNTILTRLTFPACPNPSPKKISEAPSTIAT